MKKDYFFKTGIKGKNAIQARIDYDKRARGYAVSFQVGDVDRDGMFGWHIDADYFNYYQKPQTRLLIPVGRRSEKKEQEAAALLEQNALAYVQEFAAAAEALGAPKMTIEMIA